MQYLLDVYIFNSEDLTLNSSVLMWPNKISPVFDQNDEVRSSILISAKNETP